MGGIPPNLWEEFLQIFWRNSSIILEENTGGNEPQFGGNIRLTLEENFGGN